MYTEMGGGTKDNLALRRKWYKILKDNGFDDIEVLAPDGQFYDMLRYPLRFDINSPEKKVQERYYAMARAFVFDYEFRDEVEKQVWQHHSEGMSVRGIAAKMNIGRGVMYFQRRLGRLRKAMIQLYLNDSDDKE